MDRIRRWYLLDENVKNEISSFTTPTNLIHVVEYGIRHAIRGEIRAPRWAHAKAWWWWGVHDACYYDREPSCSSSNLPLLSCTIPPRHSETPRALSFKCLFKCHPDWLQAPQWHRGLDTSRFEAPEWQAQAAVDASLTASSCLEYIP